MKGKYYILWVSIYGEDWENEEKYIFKQDEQLAERFRDEYDNEHKKEDGSYIPNIESIEYNIAEYTDEGIRDLITVSEYLELNPDKKTQ